MSPLECFLCLPVLQIYCDCVYLHCKFIVTPGICTLCVYSAVASPFVPFRKQWAASKSLAPVIQPATLMLHAGRSVQHLQYCIRKALCLSCVLLHHPPPPISHVHVRAEGCPKRLILGHFFFVTKPGGGGVRAGPPPQLYPPLLLPLNRRFGCDADLQ